MPSLLKVSMACLLPSATAAMERLKLSIPLRTVSTSTPVARAVACQTCNSSIPRPVCVAMVLILAAAARACLPNSTMAPMEMAAPRAAGCLLQGCH